MEVGQGYIVKIGVFLLYLVELERNMKPFLMRRVSRSGSCFRFMFNKDDSDKHMVLCMCTVRGRGALIFMALNP